MQIDSGALAVLAEPFDVQIEGRDGATLPVHVPDVDGKAIDAGGARPDEVQGLLAAIRRLENVVEEETVALETGTKIDFDDFSARKSRSMLEFVRLMRARTYLGGEAEVTEEVQRLRQKLERNRQILEMHYDAVREVATIIVRAIKEAESDGTYTRTARDGK
ncbi:flagellar biosynthesis protein FlgN [Bradyrhizobium roseum]|uniref:flagellar biosynthesis protein FlgN n=1 Tax=Bradyrhizobium roseum TaxID=3056648 RepID=UPI002619D7FF|nr:flagellar biosynthesis protein FlgN [Bradyrhizobium roseus]WKA27280.1 flagellar biosynthesis protein FlgN [Bradyrhizobium roseus]